VTKLSLLATHHRHLILFANKIVVVSAPWDSFADYGGNNGNFGLLPTVLAAPAAAHKVVAERGLQNLVGVGLTMEGIHTNWVINEALLEQGWRFTPQNDTSSWYEDWVTSFSRRRYGSSDAMLAQAWHILANRSEVSVYNGPRGHYFGSWGNTRSLVVRLHHNA
jgi:hypothetical protein